MFGQFRKDHTPREELSMGIWSWLFGSEHDHRDRRRAEKEIDKAVDMTFPASDAVVTGGATSTEPPSRPGDREAPIISKEDIERARRGSDDRQS